MEQERSTLIFSTRERNTNIFHLPGRMRGEIRYPIIDDLYPEISLHWIVTERWEWQTISPGCGCGCGVIRSAYSSLGVRKKGSPLVSCNYRSLSLRKYFNNNFFTSAPSCLTNWFGVHQRSFVQFKGIQECIENLYICRCAPQFEISCNEDQVAFPIEVVLLVGKSPGKRRDGESRTRI